MQLGSPTGLYGAERWILALVRHLDPDRIESIVGAVKDDPELSAPLCTRARQMGIETRIFDSPGKASFSAVRQLREFIKSRQIDILHTHAYKQDIIGLLSVRGLNCRLVSTPHGWSRDAGFKLQCYEMLNRTVFPFFDAVVPLSRDLYDPLAGWPFMKEKLHFIQNGVDTDEIMETQSVAAEIQAVRQKGRFVLGYIGQLIHRKGLDVLLEAISLSPCKDSLELVLVGEGEARGCLEKQAGVLGIERQVHFMGFRQNRLEFLNGFDTFVLPSRLEGIPRCLMEAMTAGIPVIASNIPGCTDLVTHNRTGILFEKDSVQGLANAIRQAMEDKAKGQDMAYTGRNKILEQYSARRMAKAYTDLFSILTRPSSAPI